MPELALIFEALPQGICVFDAEERLLFHNRNYALFYDLPQDVLAPGTPRRMLGVVSQAADRPLATEPRDALDATVLAHGGRFFTVRYSPVAGGGWVEIHDEVTARVRAEQDLSDARAALAAAQARAERQARDVQIAHDRLQNAFEAVPEGLVLLDAEDRYVLWNSRYAEAFVRPEDELVPGTRFETMLRAGLARGDYPDAIGREADWLEARMRRHRQPRNSHEQCLPNGRWVRVEEKRTPDGGTIGVRIDITEIKRREESFRLLFDVNPLPMYVFDRTDLRFLAVNDAALALYGFSRSEFLEMSVLDIRPESDREAVIQAVRSNGGNYNAERTWTHLTASGEVLEVNVYTKALIHGGQEAALSAIMDMSEIKRVERELSRTRGFLDNVIESIPYAVFAKDMLEGGAYILVNRSCEAAMNRPKEQIIGRTDTHLYGSVTAERSSVQDWEVMQTGTIMTFEESVQSDDQQRILSTKKLPVAEASGEPPRYLLGLQEDVTERRRFEQNIAYMAHHDPLTGLANRVLFQERLETATARARSLGENAAVQWIDLDRFKEVNDTLGHRVGDALLRSVADRLRSVLRSTDTVARLGGDEFAIVQSPLRDRDAAASLAGRCIEALSAPYLIEGRQILIAASIGVALSSNSAHDPEMLIRNADTALYRAKAEGRARYDIYDPARRPVRGKPVSDEDDLRDALLTGQLELHYQPIVSLAAHRICACEALLRWNHPERGLVSPEEFLPLAEASGLIVPIGNWVMLQACREAANWPEEVRVAVNLSPAQFASGSLVQSVESALSKSGIAAARLELEITESVLLIANAANLDVLHELRKLGISISLDDFGTGYSSLSYLRAFPFDRIKIDRSFVKDLETSADCLAIVRAVVGLGTSFRVKTTAEGVETTLQVDQLRAEGCDEVQGFLFSRPQPASSIRGILTLGEVGAWPAPSP